MNMHKIIFSALLFISTGSMAQIDTADNFDYSKFGEAEGVTRYCTQKVLNQSPQRIISIGFERYGSFEMPDIRLAAMLPAQQSFQVNKVSSFRAQVNIPVISNNRIIWQMGANYWGSKFDIDQPGTNQFAKTMNSHALTSAGINSTIFKPLNEKNFLIIQASADLNGLFNDMSAINNKALTLSGTFIYGWKKSEKNMIGTGIARTYRAGQLIHVPVLFWNKTFNDKWGMELLLPARGFMRYNFSTSNTLQAGFELEGNQFWMSLPNSQNGSVFIQRGEMKPRIMWDKKVSGFVWFHAELGMRYNWRFDVMNVYDGKKDNQRYFSSKLGNPLYFNIGFNFVSP
jgi:hypothetical protein